MAAIPPSNPPSVTAVVPQIQNRTRFVHKYTPAEQAILEQFREGYLKLDTPQLRTQFFKASIWPAMFVHWRKQHPLSEEEVKSRSRVDLAAWVHNTWRQQPKTTVVNLSIRKSDYLWDYRRDDVWKEIASMLGVPEANSSTPNWFPTRTKAIQNLLSKMTPTEKDQLELEIEKIAAMGHSTEVQCRMAEKHCTQRFDANAKSHWLEMGALTLSFVSYTTSTGQLAVELNEAAADLAGVRMPSFEERHPTKVKEMQRLWLEYVRDIVDKKNGVRHATNQNMGGSPDTELTVSVLETTEDGYPFLPEKMDFDKISKKAGAAIMRQYLRQHYFLASNQGSDQVPYREFAKGAPDLRRFIRKEYLPPSFRLINPQNHKLEEIREFLKFISTRQALMPMAEVFRFSRVKTGRKGDTAVKTMYPNEIDKENPPERKKKVSKNTLKRNRASKTKDKDADSAALQPTLNQDGGGRAEFSVNSIPAEPHTTTGLPEGKESLIDFDGLQHTFRVPGRPVADVVIPPGIFNGIPPLQHQDIRQADADAEVLFGNFNGIPSMQYEHIDRPVAIAAAHTPIGNLDFYRQDRTSAGVAMPQEDNFNLSDFFRERPSNSEFSYAEFEDAIGNAEVPDAVPDLHLPPELSGQLEATQNMHFHVQATVGNQTGSYSLDLGLDSESQTLPGSSHQTIDRLGIDDECVPRSLVELPCKPLPGLPLLNPNRLGIVGEHVPCSLMEPPSQPQIECMGSSHSRAIQLPCGQETSHSDNDHGPNGPASKDRPKPVPVVSTGRRLPTTHQEMYRRANADADAEIRSQSNMNDADADGQITLQSNVDNAAKEDVAVVKAKKKRTHHGADDLAIEEAAATAVEGKRQRRPKVRG